MALLPVADALRLLLDGAAPLKSERVPLHDAAGRVLAGRLSALRTQPPFDASAMDGYAVRAEDVASVPVRLDVVGVSAAGHGFRGRAGKGQAVRILTGAPVPDGADTIVIQENTRPAGPETIDVLDTAASGRHIRRRGLDFSEGDALLEQGRILDAAALSLAASANHAELDVVGRPLVAIIATGDELLPPGSELGPDQIIASNGYGVAAIASAAGARILDLGIVRDDRAAIADRLGAATEAGADIVVTLGGASVGDHDLVHDVLTEQGVTLGFWKIAMRPGKPLMFGRRGDTRFIGMPGNPVASLVCSHLFLKPLVARLGGRFHEQDIRAARLGAAMGANDLREDYVRAKIEIVDGQVTATPFGLQDSSMLRILAESGGLIIREPFALPAAEGETCKVLMLR
ncbi:molybdopterin molybdotransferase MoeA [Mesorhizobium sp. LHD-90]|uniref:molybdopterin molybdotransferase MoeA n=1 Tax=Mesorhizobium sp. LHD-90 TaxID=3071414 RepID=UPI0027E096DE|nr:gephyrin-like molybdotransferase Glp [Mesorhizobium sp. LHD-90]MDQ6437693.1 molybdopterin molybdotransferase MoeA [Mesorhizobium sp. LHD-90]